MAKIAVYAKIKLPIFSVKHPEVFQISTCLPAPQPSTLIGALAYAIAVSEGIGSDEAFEKTRRIVSAARSNISSRGLLAVPSTIVLRRFRILDKGMEAKKRGKPAYTRLLENVGKGNYAEAKRIVEGELTDALYRDYMFAQEIDCIWILEEEVDVNIVKLIHRLGDTESLCTVVEAWSEEAEVFEDNETRTRFPLILDHVKEISGDYAFTRMCDEDRVRREFIIPQTREVRRLEKGVKAIVYKPTTIRVSFDRNVRIAKTSSGDQIVLPQRTALNGGNILNNITWRL